MKPGFTKQRETVIMYNAEEVKSAHLFLSKAAGEVLTLPPLEAAWETGAVCSALRRWPAQYSQNLTSNL